MKIFKKAGETVLVLLLMALISLLVFGFAISGISTFIKTYPTKTGTERPHSQNKNREIIPTIPEYEKIPI